MTKKQVKDMLIKGARGNDSEKVRIALNLGADINATDEIGLTALHWAVKEDHIDMVKYLISHGANVNITSPHSLETPLHTAAFNNKLSSADVLMENGADPSSKNKEGQTPLHISARVDALSLSELLIEKGADVNARDNSNSTPVHIGALCCSFSVVKLLVQKGANVNAQDTRGWTPLHIAYNIGIMPMAKLLTELGAAHTILSKKGEEPQSLFTHSIEELIESVTNAFKKI